jgi:hypothetical protein
MPMRLGERNRIPQERIAEKFINSAFITNRNPYLENLARNVNSNKLLDAILMSSNDRPELEEP